MTRKLERICILFRPTLPSTSSKIDFFFFFKITLITHTNAFANWFSLWNFFVSILLTNRKWKLDREQTKRHLACWSFSSTRTWLQADWRDTRARKYQQRLRGVATKRSGSGGWFCGSRQWWGRSLIGGILGESFVDEEYHARGPRYGYTSRRRWTLEKGYVWL